MVPDCRRVKYQGTSGVDSGLSHVDALLLVILVVTFGNSPSSTILLLRRKRLGLVSDVLVEILSNTETLLGALEQQHSDNTALIMLAHGQ